MHFVEKAEYSGVSCWLHACALCALLLLGTKGKIGRGTGGPSSGARPVSGPERYIERYPEPEQDVPPTLEQLAKQRVYDFDPKQGLYLDGFTVWTVDDLGRPDPAQQEYVALTGRKLDNGDYHLVIHVKKAPVLTYLFVYVRYYQEQWHPRDSRAGQPVRLRRRPAVVYQARYPGRGGAPGMARVRPDNNGGDEGQRRRDVRDGLQPAPFRLQAVLAGPCPGRPPQPNRATSRCTRTRRPAPRCCTGKKRTRATSTTTARSASPTSCLSPSATGA